MSGMGSGRLGRDAPPEAGENGLPGLSLGEAAETIRQGRATSTELTRACLGRIADRNGEINAIVTVMADTALDRAALLDREAAKGTLRSPIHGVPIVLKDNIDTAGTRTAAASAIYDSRIPDADAEVCRRLLDAGCVLLGKANLDEFANGISCVTSAEGLVRNPLDPTRIAGGSSGGSAAALAAHMCYGAMGTDTGGSIRAPATFCGLVGLKPTYGLISNRGIIPVVPFVDTCGPMARTVEDVALLLDQLAGYDRLDPASEKHDWENYHAGLASSPRPIRIGVARTPFAQGLDDDIAVAFENAVRLLGQIGVLIDGFELPSAYEIDPLPFYAERHSIHRRLLSASRDKYLEPTLRELEAGERAVNGAGDDSPVNRVADFIDAQRALTLMRRTIDDAFSDVDVIVLPSTKCGARTISRVEKDLIDDPQAALPMFVNSIPFNIYGLPALTLPCGSDANGMPVGLTIAGRHFSESVILQVARQFELALGYRLPAGVANRPI